MQTKNKTQPKKERTTSIWRAEKDAGGGHSVLRNRNKDWWNIKDPCHHIEGITLILRSRTTLIDPPVSRGCVQISWFRNIRFARCDRAIRKLSRCLAWYQACSEVRAKEVKTTTYQCITRSIHFPNRIYMVICEYWLCDNIQNAISCRRFKQSQQSYPSDRQQLCIYLSSRSWR